MCDSNQNNCYDDKPSKCIPDCGECPPIRDITLSACTIAETPVVIFPLDSPDVCEGDQMFNGFITQFPIPSSQGGTVETYPQVPGAVQYTPPQLDPECPAPFIGCDNFIFTVLDKSCRKTYVRVFVEVRSDLLSAQICGKVFLNGEIVENIQVELGGGGASDPLSTLSTDTINIETDSNYCLGLLFPGTYTVTLIKPPDENIVAVPSIDYEIDSDGNIVFQVCALEGLTNLSDAFFINEVEPDQRGTVEGRVFYDCERNGTEEGEDFGFDNIQITLSNPTFGNYTTQTLNGDWTLDVPAGNNWTLTTGKPFDEDFGDDFSNWTNTTGNNSIQTPLIVLPNGFLTTSSVGYAPNKEALSGNVSAVCGVQQKLSKEIKSDCEGCGKTLLLSDQKYDTTTSRNILGKKVTGANFNKFDLFDIKPVSVGARDLELFPTLELKSEVVKQLYESEDKTFSVDLPGPNGEIYTVLLYEVQILSNDFMAKTSDGTILPKPKGRYYHGVVENHKSSVTISVYEDRIAGVITVEDVDGDLNLLQEKGTNNYQLRPSTTDQKWICLSDTSKFREVQESLNKQITSRALSTKCTDIYFDVCNDVYQFFGNDATAAENYIIDVFASVNQIFQQAQPTGPEATLRISGIMVWTVDPPFDCSQPDLNGYSNYRSSNAWNGNLAHMVTFNFVSGVAWLGGLCNNNLSYGITGMRSSEVSGQSLNPAYPTYSWNASTIAHELGHNFGSPHTFDCAWVRNAMNNQSLGGCGIGNQQCFPCSQSAPQGGCTQPGEIPEGNTIMGYCDGYSLLNGFGPQPAALVRNAIDNAPCLTACPTEPDCNDFVVSSESSSDTGSNDGTITVQASGGNAGAYIFILSNGDNFVGPSPHTFTGLQCGNYQITVKTDTETCEANISEFVGASIGQLQNVTVTGGPCNVNVSLTLDNNGNYNAALDPIPRGIPAGFPDKMKYTVTITRPNPPYVKFTKVFGVDGDDTSASVSKDIFETDFGVGGISSLVLGDTVLSQNL